MVLSRVEELLHLVEALAPGGLVGDTADDLARVKQAAQMLRDEAIRLAENPDRRQVRHDLRNPLGALIGYADLLSEDGLDVSAIRTAAAELLEFLDTL